MAERTKSAIYEVRQPFAVQGKYRQSVGIGHKLPYLALFQLSSVRHRLEDTSIHRGRAIWDGPRDD